MTTPTTSKGAITTTQSNGSGNNGATGTAPSPQGQTKGGSSTSVSSTTAGASNLGWGVNALSGNILSAYLQPIFDQNKLFPAKKPSIPQQANLNEQTTLTFTGEYGYDYLVSQSASVGISGHYAGFSGSLHASFGTTQSQEFTENYGTCQYTFQLYQLTIPSSAFQSLLADGFKNDLNTMAPLDFYNKYGPYFTSSVIVGGALNSSIYTVAQTTYSDTSMSVSASAAYNEGIAGGKVNTSYTYTDQTTKTTYTCNSGITVVGGTSKFDANNAFDVTEWEQTIVGNPATISYTLTPMWQLLPTGQRQTDLINAIDAYFNQPNPNLLSPLTLKTFTATSNVTGTESMGVAVATGYKVLGGGASLQQSSPNNQFLTSSSVVKGAPPNQWNSSAKSMYNATNASLTSYAIAVYDPADLLDVEVFDVKGGPTTQDTYSFLYTVPVGAGYVMTGGGIATYPSNTNGLIISASYPTSQTQWTAAASAHSGAACTGSVDVSVIGIKWQVPAGKPPLVVVQQSITSNMPTEIPSQMVGVAANCAMVGGGANINSGTAPPVNYNSLQNSYPSSATQWTASGHDAKVACNAVITAYTLGLQVKWQKADGSGFVYLPFGPGCLTPPSGCVVPTSSP
ncbi:MAG TPA: MAC/perforin domain-containing protein [Chthonomonadaceae bacterium]|nr:MAC/perforin domain-containing protein [Chthonomonadaceae bacterium]